MKNKKKIIILIIALCLILFILSIFSTGTYSKFFGKILGESKTEIAEPVFVLENTDKKIVDNSNQEVDYYFKVKNYNNSSINEVNLKYILEITPIQDKAITLTLYKDNQKIDLNNQKTSYIGLGHTTKQEHQYRLNVKYNKNNQENSYDINSSIFIKANDIQNYTGVKI